MELNYDIRLNPEGVFEIHWNDGKRQRSRSLRTKLPSEAMQNAKAAIDEILLEMKKLGLDEVFGKLLDYYMLHHGPKILDKTRIKTINNNLLAQFVNFRPADIDQKLVKQYTRKRKEGVIGHPSTSGTIRRELGHLTAVINYAARHRLISREQIPFIELPTAPPPKERWLSKDEVKKLLDNLDGQDFRVELFAHIALRTGARWKAILDLKWSSVDFERGLIDFSNGDRKTSAKRRATVPISDALLPKLRRAKDFYSGHSAYVMGEANCDIRSQFDRLVRKHKGFEDVTPKVLRHTWASHASMNGVSFTEIARVLGNSSAMVEKVYAKFAPDYLKDAVNSVGF